MIFRRLPASSSFVLAAARLRALQLDSSAAAADPGHLRGRPRRIVKPAPGRQQHVVTGPDPYALLTTVALMGAESSASPMRMFLHWPASSFVVPTALAVFSAALLTYSSSEEPDRCSGLLRLTAVCGQDEAISGHFLGSASECGGSQPPPT